MLEQWFLDLDGVRSGPYQTSEVMSLIAEGEVLPHHLISTELKSQNWTTILEWRLHQNKTPLKTPSTPTTSTSPLEEPKSIEFDQPSTAKEVVYEVPENSTLKNQEPKTESAPAVSAAPEPAPAARNYTASISPASNSGPQRDPMAEMFDMLQNSKHKREQKAQQQSSHQPHTPPQTSSPSSTSSVTFSNAPTPSESGGFLKTAIAGAVVIVIGFFLGQYFQKLNHKEAPTEQALTSAPTKTSEVVAPKPTPNLEQTRELVDQSNDKITIRSRVPVRTEPHLRHEPEVLKNAKDMEDIKDLKKELMELKALKEEIRNNAEPELPVPAPNENPAPATEPGSADNALIPGFVPEQPTQPIENNGENNSTDTSGANKAENEIHY